MAMIHNLAELEVELGTENDDRDDVPTFTVREDAVRIKVVNDCVAVWATVKGEDIGPMEIRFPFEAKSLWVIVNAVREVRDVALKDGR